MTIKSLKRFTKILNRTEGVSLMAIIILMVIMAMMGGVFSTIMGRWKLSAPSTINSNKAFYLAETAAMFALQDARYRFYGGSFNYGTRGTPYVVISSSTEEANYWFERPNDDDFYSSDDDSDSYDDDDISGPDDDNVDDDADDVSNPTLYTIIATGKVLRDGTTVAKRQIKIKATITDNSSSPVAAGIQTDGSIQGTGANATHFDIENPDTGASVTYAKTADVVTSGSETDIVYRPAATLDEDMFKALSDDQSHTQSGNPFTPSDNYPNSSYYYSGSVPNVTYVENGLTVSGNREIYGIYWIKGDVSLSGNYRINGIIICEGDITMSGGGSQSPNLNGGIIQYGAGTLTGNGNAVDIDINIDLFDDLNATVPNITIVSWQEAVSAN